ncbi:MAG: MmcQ/YjbR family DNA-binding protein [Rhodothermales bacterium]|nr:MmcQ/YjbR family DNA-binding protein [Rhodothermales bacterium]MBO6780930.1 MmcQ/YjbR family DNA-binding protein [Rhodothermales bacterium]
MTFDAFHEFVHSLPDVTEGTPFGPNVLVFKVGGKMFALIGLDEVEPYVNLKCDPERAVELREEYLNVRPGYHMNKTHWNSVDLRGDVPGALIRELIVHSWELVVGSLPRKERDRIEVLRDA